MVRAWHRAGSAGADRGPNALAPGDARSRAHRRDPPGPSPAQDLCGAATRWRGRTRRRARPRYADSANGHLNESPVAGTPRTRLLWAQFGSSSARARLDEAVHQLVAFPRVSRLVLAAVWGSGGSPGAKVVGASGGKPGPLGGRASVRAKLATFGIPPLWPASGRVFPGLLPTIHSHV